jgi:hypothetical protein
MEEEEILVLVVVEVVVLIVEGGIEVEELFLIIVELALKIWGRVQELKHNHFQ